MFILKIDEITLFRTNLSFNEEFSFKFKHYNHKKYTNFI